MSEQVHDVWLVVDDKHPVAWAGLGVGGNGHGRTRASSNQVLPATYEPGKLLAKSRSVRFATSLNSGTCYLLFAVRASPENRLK